MNASPSICPDCGAAFDGGVFGGLCPSCMMGGSTLLLSGTAASTVAKPGDLPGYTMSGILGRGGMGSVYRAQQLDLGRDVAVKIISEKGLDPEFAERFLREAKILARLEHPNIPPIYDLGQDDEGRLFYSMKIVKGRTLQAILTAIRAGEEKAVSLARLVEIFRRVCDAVAFAHSRGVIHRDLKPENIMVGEFGEVLVMDWGLARTATADDDCQPPVGGCECGGADGMTLTGTVLGTPHYMSPEQAGGREVDERTDVYALGGVLYAMLTLRPPVAGESVKEILAKVKTGEILPPTQDVKHLGRARVPSALAAVTLKALARDRENRFASVGELAADMDAWQAGFATRAEDAGLWALFWLFVKRHRTISLAALSVLVLSTGFMVKVIASERTARRTLSESRLSLAEAAFRQNDWSQMQTQLALVPEDLRGTDWRYLTKRADMSVTAIHDDAPVIAAAAHPREPGVFALLCDRDVRLMRVRDKRVVREFPGVLPQGGTAVAFSADGSCLAAGGRKNVVILDSADGRVLHHLPSPENSMELVFSPDGSRLMQRSNGVVIMWHVAQGKMLWQHRYQPQDVLERRGVAIFHPDARRVIIGNAALVELDVETGAHLRTLGGTSGLVASAALHSNGSRIFMLTTQGEVTCREAESGRFVWSVRDEWGVGVGLQLSADGRHIVTMAQLNNKLHTLRVRDASDGWTLRTLSGGTGDAQQLVLHPLTGEALACTPGLRLWNASSPAESFSEHSTKNCHDLDFFGADDVLLAGIRESTAAVVHLDGRQLWKDPNNTLPHHHVSADGRHAALLANGRSTTSDFVLLLRDGDTVREIARHPLTDAHLREQRIRVQLSADARTVLFVPRKREAALHDTASGQCIAKLELDDASMRVFDAAWVGAKSEVAGIVGPESNGPVPAAQQSLVIWDGRTGRELRRAPVGGEDETSCIAITPDGCQFAEAGFGRRVRIRDAATLAVTREFRAHDDVITALAWHPLRHQLATSSEDLTMRLWDVDLETLLHEWHGFARGPKAIRISPGGRFIAANDNSQRQQLIRVWKLE